jgi:FAD/FMN-containing dehydrogenase
MDKMHDLRSHLEDAIADPTVFLDAPEELSRYGRDWTGKFQGETPLVLRPNSTEQVQALLAVCHRKGIAVVPQGGNTGLVGGSVPRNGEVVLSLSRLNAIEGFDEPSASVTVQAGTVLEALQGFLAGKGQMFPVDLGARGSCQIGGMIATNAGGIKVLRYGHMREQVLGLEVVLADGTVLSNLNRLRKNNTGLDLKQLFIGSEGILGVITRAVLRCQPAPAQRQTALLGLERVDMLPAVLMRLRAALSELSSLEFFLKGALELVCARFDDVRDPLARPHAAYVLVECESGHPASARFHEVLAEALEDGAVADAVVAQSGAQAEALWFLREGIAEAISKTGLTHKFDVTVPPGAIPSFIEGIRDLAARFEGVRPVFFGHLGDGNLHLNMVQGASLSDAAFRTLEEEITEPVYALVADFEGSIIPGPPTRSPRCAPSRGYWIPAGS